jgi:predicted small secreted protein
MLQKFATVALLGVALSVAACNTVRGAASDVNSVANCTENAMNGGNC